MLRKLLFVLCFTGLLVPAALAQSGTLTGTVTDAQTGKTVPTANVLLKQIQRGAATDDNGNFTITNVPTGTYTLRVTFVGYQAYSKQVTIKSGTNTVNVQLKVGAIGLNALVVTGYTTTSRKELTSSISNVSSEDIKDVPLENAAGLLQGRAAGLRVTSTSGTPGSGFSVRIRGTGTINAGSRPLYIVDGVELNYGNTTGRNPSSPLNAIPPNNIESIQVLKDAAATAIYGSEGANGVIIINTKQGQKGKTQVSASYQQGVVSNIKNNEYFDREQFIKYFQLANQYDFGDTPDQALQRFRQNTLPAFGFDPSTNLSALPNTDWFKYNFQTGNTRQYNMTISGGNDQSSYSVAGTYLNKDGYIRTNNYQNYALNGNFNQQVSSRFSVNENVKLSEQKYRGVCQDGFFINCPISQAAFTSPLSEPYRSDGSLSTFFPLIGALNNPAITFNHVSRPSRKLQILGSLAGTYDITSWLSLHTQFAMDYRNEESTRHDDNVADPSDNGRTTVDNRPSSNFQNTNRLNFDYTFNEVHNVSGLAGFSYRRVEERLNGSQGIGFPNSLFSVLSTAAQPTSVFGFNREYRRVGYFAQVKYNYKQKYSLKLAGRYGGSSKFGKDKRFGFFPSIAGSWDIAGEKFLKSDKVNTLKLRASYGITGNSSFGGGVFYPARGLYSAGGSYQGVTAISPSQLANSVLTWESQRDLDFGLDYGFFKSRVSGSIDIYRNKRNDLLLNNPLPLDSGFGSITRNLGSIRNQGIEFELHTVNFQSKDFQWRTNFNLTLNRNKVLKLSGGKKRLNPGSSQPIAVGHSLRAWQVVPSAGVNPADGRPFWYDENGNLTYQPDDTHDRKFVGNADENEYGGLGNTFSYKGFSLNVFFNYSFGQLAVPNQVVAFGINQVGGNGTNGLLQRLTEAWKKPGDIARFAAPTNFFGYPGTDGYFKTSSDKLFNASYVRLKSVKLSYNLPTSLMQDIHLRGIQLFVVGANLYTWTPYIGFDPEIAGVATTASVPVGRTVNGGINVQF